MKIARFSVSGVCAWLVPDETTALSEFLACADATCVDPINELAAE